jgi:spore coat polysaccharide biosynthesis protein SpsF
VLSPILGAPMLARQVERLRRARRIDALVVATSTDAADDGLVAVCSGLDIELARGSLSDVLDRVYHAAAKHAPGHVVRLTGDCPLADPQVIDQVIEAHLATDSDYTSNALTPTFPDGLDVEVVRFVCLEEAWRSARLKSEREHVTPYLYNNPNEFRLHAVTTTPDRSAMRWTVDQQEDLEFVRRVYEALYPTNPAFSAEDVYRLLEREPSLAAVNAHLRRNEGYESSVRNERAQESP